MQWSLIFRLRLIETKQAGDSLALSQMVHLMWICIASDTNSTADYYPTACVALRYQTVDSQKVLNKGLEQHLGKGHEWFWCIHSKESAHKNHSHIHWSECLLLCVTWEKAGYINTVSTSKIQGTCWELLTELKVLQNVTDRKSNDSLPVFSFFVYGTGIEQPNSHFPNLDILLSIVMLFFGLFC